ncbi:YidH family protein [Pseudopontixanthobacter vadosimaris]|uniref:YidH family protein n=1 Tax=Pseudopontixanthobacter vadosimaris TaxID=2726450 RepID=UPI00147538EB|nr:DUF202 domain-containing protein [Pseudopontixanthobacter vadosimaris]
MSDDTNSSNDSSIDLAEQRTDLAEDRNIMAVERTFAGWMRTAFAAIGIGLAFRAVFGEFQPPWLAKAIATMFVAAGGILAIVAQRRTCKTMARLNSHRMKPASTPNFRLLGFAVAFGAAVLIAGLWVLNNGEVAPST